MEWIRAYTEEVSDCFPPPVISDTCAEIETVVRALRLRWGEGGGRRWIEKICWLGWLCEIPYMVRIRPFGAVAAMMSLGISFPPNDSYFSEHYLTSSKKP